MTHAKAERITGYSIACFAESVDAYDADGVVVTSVEYNATDYPKGIIGAVSALVDKVYRLHGLEAFRRCGGKCNYCGRNLNGKAWERDHSLSRARGQRSDAVENLKVCCSSADPRGCGVHRKRHGG